jgi:hypothetical protein
MRALRTKMIEEMTRRNFSPRTQQSYKSAVVGLVKHYRRFPDQLTQDEIRSYLLHLKERNFRLGWAFSVLWPPAYHNESKGGHSVSKISDLLALDIDLLGFAFALVTAINVRLFQRREDLFC